MGQTKLPKTATDEAIQRVLEKPNPSYDDFIGAMGALPGEELLAYVDRLSFEIRLARALAEFCRDPKRTLGKQITKADAEDIEEAVIDTLAKEWAEEMAEET